MAVTPPWLKAAAKQVPVPTCAQNGPAASVPLWATKPTPKIPREGPKGSHQDLKGNRKKAKGVASAATVEGTCITAMPALDVEEPSTAMKVKFEEFARLFLIDFNMTKTAIRMGYSQRSAAVLGNRMFWHPYTQIYLSKLIRETEEHALVNRNQVLAGLLREANNFNVDASSSSRISAWREIGKILGMYIQRVEISANSSGVMEVPLVANVDQWEAAASLAQSNLLEMARE